MQYLPGTNKACVTFSEISDIMTRDQYDSLKKRKKIKTHGRGGNGRQVLIEIASLPPQYRAQVIEKVGNPDEVLQKQPITNHVAYDYEAEQFYLKYELPEGGKLPHAYVEKYTTAANWLNMLKEVTEDKKRIKNVLQIDSMTTFWATISELIKAHNIDLPKNRIRLQEKIALYKEQGYESLVEEWRFKNSNRSKIKDIVAEALLLELLANGMQHDDTIIMMKYNQWAKQTGRQEILSVSTIGNFRRANDWKIKAQRQGRKASYDTYGVVINRKRPSAPLLLINSDDNELDLFFRHTVIRDGKETVTPYKRYVLVVVIDTFNDYPLGYAIGETQTGALVKQAYLNALYHIKELTNGFYLPHQVQTDRWGLDAKLNNDLSRFYKAIGTFTPAKQYNARSKYIERSFGTEWHQFLKMYANYSGHNITAQEKLNPDVVALNKRDYPSSEQAPVQIAHFIDQLRQAKGRQQQWIEAFAKSEKSRQRLADDEYLLTLFGIRHDYQHTINSEGLTIRVQGIEYKYMIPEALYLQNVGKRVQVYFDPMDMRRVLVTDDNTLRFVAHEKMLLPAALADYEPGTRKALNDMLEMGKRNMLRIADEAEKRKKILEEGGINAQSMLQAGVLDKGLKQEATQKYLEDTYGKSSDSRDFDPYDLL